MRLKKTLLLLALLINSVNLLAQGGSYLTKPDKDLMRITAPLDSFNRRLPVEKVYLHLDKPYYNIGDTLWLKSYLLDGVNLTGSKLSGLLYVELDNDSSQMVRRISIPIKKGLGWGQIALTGNIFHEGGYTLRAYTNWMQNFGEDYVFSQRFYLGVPAREAWLVKSTASITRVADKDQLNVSLLLNRADKLASPVAFRKVEVKIYEGKGYYLYNEQLQTGIDGSLKFSHFLKAKIDGRQIRVQIRSLEKGDGDKLVQVPLTVNRNQNIDVQFLPESGNLVAGLKSAVGFKAIGEDGKSTPVMGAIYNSKGTEITSFTAVHNGMGAFEFTPMAGEVYTAKISQPIVKSFALPKVNAEGTIMRIVNAEAASDLKVSLYASAAISHADSVCYLIGTSRGVMYYSQKVELNQPDISVSKKLFPSGIVRFTLFKGNSPLNERAVFIDNHDELIINIKPNKTNYKKRDSVGLNIEIKDKSGFPVQGSFSLAVTDDSQVRADSIGNYGINTSILLNADLKGTVEDPGYYINRKDKQAWQALDLLMLTQGWTGYIWKDVFTANKPPRFEAEKDFKITGRLTNLTSKPIANTTVLISSRKPSFLATTITNADGYYLFKNLPAIDSGSFFLQGNNQKGKRITFGNLSVNKFKPPLVPSTIRDQVLPWYVNTDTPQLNYVKRVAEKAKEENIKLTGYVLKEVKIKSKKIIKDSMNPFGPGEGDLIFDEEDIKKSATINLYELLMQKVPELQILGARPVVFRDRYEHIPVLGLRQFEVDLRIDGRPLPLSLDVPLTPMAHILYADSVHADDFIFVLRTKWDEYYQNCVAEVIDELSEYKIISLKGLEISWSRKYTNRIINAPKTIDIARIDITTINGVGWYRDVSPGTATYRPLPVMRPQQFYRPKYNTAPGAVIVPDYRSTIHWEPNITTDQNGKAKVSFYTSDIAGKYTVTMAGADVAGWIGDAQIKINK